MLMGEHGPAFQLATGNWKLATGNWQLATGNRQRTMKFAICNELFEGWAFDRVCRYVKSVGYDGLELAPFTLAPLITDLDARQRAALRKQAADAGVDIIGLHWLLARTEGLHLTSPDREVRTRTAEYLGHLAQATRDLGGDLMVFGSPKQRSLMDGVSWDQAFDYAAETFRRAMLAVADSGVRICMEPLATTETNFINTCAEGARLMDAVGHANFVLHLDVKAMSSERTPITELIRQFVPRTGHFPVNDPNMKGPGFGEVDFVPIFRALEDAGYKGWVSVEVFDYTPDPETITVGSIEYMRRCLEKQTGDGRKGEHSFSR
jgi:sugar phosphate isomerase/epimerase